MTAECVRCTRPMPDVAYCCPSCVAVAAENLSRVTEYTPAARDVAQGQSRRGGGGGSGKPGSRLPLDLTATAKLDAVQRELTRWVDWIGTQRGATRPWFTQTGDEIVIACRWLADHLEWMRHQPNREPDRDGRTWGADEFLTDVEAAARVMRSVARGPAEVKFLGICGAVITWDEDDNEIPRDEPCGGAVFGNAKQGACRACKARWDDVGQRLARLDAEVRERLFTAKDIADAYQLNVKTIRSWRTRGLLAAHGHDTAGTPLHKIGEVLDLAVGEKVRREEARTARARRLEQQRSGGQAA